MRNMPRSMPPGCGCWRTPALAFKKLACLDRVALHCRHVPEVRAFVRLCLGVLVHSFGNHSCVRACVRACMHACLCACFTVACMPLRVVMCTGACKWHVDLSYGDVRNFLIA